MMQNSAEAPTVDVRYPIGRYEWPAEVSEQQRQDFIDEIEQLPALLANAVEGLTDQQLDTPYRPGGWTVRQLVHHLADSHINLSIRFRFALTEDNPPVRAYDEKTWAELPDAKTAPVESSLALLAGLHDRFVALLRQMTDEQWSRTFQHSERGTMRLDRTVGLYAWHGEHHLAHIRALREREKW